MDEKCVCCGEKEIQCKKRMLCNCCYQSLRTIGRLNEFPPIRVLPHPNNWIGKYGEGIIGDLENLINDYHSTLVSVGVKYGISRERVRQMFELLYGFKYTVARKAKTEIKKKKRFAEIIAKRDPRYKAENYKENSPAYKGAQSEKKVYDICSSLNYEIKPFNSSSIDILINGYKVEIKSSHRTCVTNKHNITPLYRFRLTKSQQNIDFVICHAVPVNKFFVLPKSICPKSGNIFIPSIKTREWKAGKNRTVTMRRVSRYYNYLEAWDLLKPKVDEIVFNKPVLVSAIN